MSKILGQVAREAYFGVPHWEHIHAQSRADWERVAAAVAKEVRERIAKDVDAHSLGFHSPHEYRIDLAAAIRAMELK